MRKQIKGPLLSAILFISLLLMGCGTTEWEATPPNTVPPHGTTSSSDAVKDEVGMNSKNLTVISPTAKETQLTEGLSAVHYEGDYGLDAFLEGGGAVSDAEVVGFLSRTLVSELAELAFSGEGFGCSTVSAHDTQGNALFGRNFDWQQCNALIVTAAPENGYSSISTVNLDFISSASSVLKLLPAKAKTLAALYAPLDGMNEKGLCAAVLVIEDPTIIDQNTEKPDLTTTTAIRLLLDKAATVDEAIALLEQYDMHSSMGMMVHFALSDAAGRSAVVEYVGNEMTVTETPVVTNFYLAEGDKNGIGSAQSHTRYQLLIEQLAKTPAMDMDAMRDAMDSVSKDNFGEFESTEWSIVYNQGEGEARYYHRENYENGFVFYFE